MTDPTPGRLRAVAVSFDDIPRSAWDRLLAVTAAATPFSRWTYHRAWWDAYGATAHAQYLVCIASDMPAAGVGGEPGPVIDRRSIDADEIVAIVPLMHRHEVEPDDHLTATPLRHSTHELGRVRPEAKAIFMGASYHADYATVLADPRDLDAVGDAVARAIAGPPDPRHGDMAWDVVDLRRLQDDDPATAALERGFQGLAAEEGWNVSREVEDVCPTVDLSADDWDGYLATLDKKARHEIRRKLRRAEAAGAVRFRLLPLDAGSVDAFITLHQARWGDDGLFPDTPGGERSRRFLHRLAELESAEEDRAQLQLGCVEVGERVIFRTVAFDDGETCFFYNAGMDPEARDLSPGVTGTAAYLRDRLDLGRRRFDFLRGDEPYKYEWGAVDREIHRLLVTRTEP